MTRDAKVGLLLGLLFIFIIAFVINGLPSFKNSDGNDLTRDMTKPRPTRNNGLGNGARQQAIRTLVPNQRPIQRPAPEPLTQIIQQQRQTPPVLTTERPTRYQMPLPRTTASRNAFEPRPASAIAINDKPKLEKPRIGQNNSIKTMKVIKPVPKQLTRIYKVKAGDNLAVIAKKFYGPELGNKHANIDKIYKANKKVLKSQDAIYVGQKLIIPALEQPEIDKPNDVLKSDKFIAVDDIGKRHIQAPPKAADKVKVKYYIVKEDDSLWAIASEQLGNGTRYKEIVKLNKIKDKDILSVGMRLKLPAK